MIKKNSSAYFMLSSIFVIYICIYCVLLSYSEAIKKGFTETSKMLKAQQHHLKYCLKCGYGKPSCGHEKPPCGCVKPPWKTFFG